MSRIYGNTQQILDSAPVLETGTLLLAHVACPSELNMSRTKRLQHTIPVMIKLPATVGKMKNAYTKSVRCAHCAEYYKVTVTLSTKVTVQHE